MPIPFSEIHGEINGQLVKTFTLTNAGGMRVKVSELGAHLLSVIMDDQELTLGHDNFEQWRNNSDAYLGATCGRFGNRIAGGKFKIGSSCYNLATNNSPGGFPCHLHGGPGGFHTKIWQGSPLEKENAQGVLFTLHSPDGDEGYPGNLNVRVTYWLNDNNELSWHAEATTDQPTPVNLVNHTYWNLSGDHDSPITDHQIQIHADYFLPTNAGMIPTGEVRSVIDTPMDFTRPRQIGEYIDASYGPITKAGGYDHCWVLRDHHEKKPESRTAAIVYHPDTATTLEVITNQPGLQFYTGNYLSSPFRHRSGLCLETEGFPDAPNQSNFPSALLSPGETYQHNITWKLSR